MRPAKAVPAAAVDELPASFVRGAVASGIVAAVDHSRAGVDLLQAALVGGGALAAGVAVENLLFNREWKVAKGKKRGKKKRAAMERAAIEALLRQNQPSGLAALTPGQQFVIGTLLGAGATYVLGDEQMRGKLLRAGLQFYGKVADGFEELKEQVGDIQAELTAQRMSAE